MRAKITAALSLRFAQSFAPIIAMTVAFIAAPAIADETPKRGGTLTYNAGDLVPDDLPADINAMAAWITERLEAGETPVHEQIKADERGDRDDD